MEPTDVQAPEQQKITTMRVYITENCNARCPSCVNAGSRNNAEMSVETFTTLCGYLAENGVHHLKIMGGEPSMHPDFEKIVGIAQERFKYVTIFSNGLNGRIKNLALRPKDCVTYNFLFRDGITKETLFLENGGERCMQVQVLKTCDEAPLAEKIIEIGGIDKSRVAAALSLDCTSNIFKDRQILLKKLLYIQNRMKANGIAISYDHAVPNCFLRGSGVEYPGNGMCSLQTAGVIDASLTLRFCNQYSSKLIKMHDGRGFVPWDVLMNQLWKTYYALRLTALEKICADCADFNKTCNGGCWIPKANISKEDVIANSANDFWRTTRAESA